MVNLPYTSDRFRPSRRPTIAVRVREKVIGGEAPILVQSMTNTRTSDIAASAAQALALANAGCELVRITTPSVRDAKNLKSIIAILRKKGCEVPVCADIHFQPKAAYEALKWADKVRINPGNFSDKKQANASCFSDSDFDKGEQKVHEVFGPFIGEAKSRGIPIRIGANHGSLSDRMVYRFGNTAAGMVESALEYLRVAEAENFDQIIFSMKASNPRVVIQAYRLLAARLAQGHKGYPFHLGVTEAGQGEDGRLKSAVGIGALLLDGLGDTIRVSLTEDPVREIPAAVDLLESCRLNTVLPMGEVNLKENIDYYSYNRRQSSRLRFSGLSVGGRHSIAVGAQDPAGALPEAGLRKAEWYSTADRHKQHANIASGFIGNPSDSEPLAHDFRILASSTFLSMEIPPDRPFEIVVDNPQHLGESLTPHLPEAAVLWSISHHLTDTGLYRYLAAWLAGLGRKDLIVLRGETDGSMKTAIKCAARLGSLLCDGLGDMIHITGPGFDNAVSLAYDILQAAGARRSKTEFISCPGCGRTLFDLEKTAGRIRSLTGHLGDVAIGIMGCIVNGPGEMGDADFGYVGGAPGKVNLYAGRKCVRKNVPEAEAPAALVELIKSRGKWQDLEN